MPADVAWTDPDEHQFFVPDRARWGAILKTAANIGEALNKACAALEEQNPALEGVLAGIDYNDERKLGDAKNRDTVLARLVQHFSQVSLRNDRMAEPDLLGRAYEYLIEQFADDAGKKGGEFYTPRMVVKLIVELLDGRVSLDDVKYLAEDRVSDALLLSRGDVLFNRTNSADLVGKVAVFDHRARVSFALYLLRLRVTSSVGTGFWLSYLLNTDTLQKRLRATATVGVSQVNINRKSLLATLVPVPPAEEQSVIVSILDSLWHRVEAEQNVVARLAEVKSSLMSVLLTGQLRVVRDPERRCASGSDQATTLPSADRRLNG